jgi:hypothetical protein
MDFIRRNPVMSLVLAVVVLVVLVVLFLAVTGSLFSSPPGEATNGAIVPDGTREIDTDASFMTNEPNPDAAVEGEGEGDPTVVPAAEQDATAAADDEVEPTVSG